MGTLAFSNSDLLIRIYGSNRRSVGLLGRVIKPPEGRYLHRAAQTQKKPGHTFMLRMGFEPTIPVFERAKMFHASDSVAIGYNILTRKTEPKKT
jgi:hypothetical protein